MARKTSHLNKIKIKPTGPLAEMIGGSAISRPQATKRSGTTSTSTDLKESRATESLLNIRQRQAKWLPPKVDKLFTLATMTFSMNMSETAKKFQ